MSAGFRVILSKPRGFCAGVDRAVLMVKRALAIFGKPIYIRHEIVHNQHVVRELMTQGAIFVEEIAEIPRGSIAIFSAHGVSQEVRAAAAAKELQVFDATCPLVTKVHLEVHKYSQENRECILIGHNGHPEVEGTLGQYTARAAEQAGKIYLVEDLAGARQLSIQNPDTVAYVTQTTLSLDDTKEIIRELKQRFPKIKEPYKDDICYATQNRQNAVKDLAKRCELLLVIGSQNSSNSNRLAELAEKSGCRSHLIDGASELQREWLSGVATVGVTAGASAPEILVLEVTKKLQEWGAANISEMNGQSEEVSFNLPPPLRSSTSNSADAAARIIVSSNAH